MPARPRSARARRRSLPAQHVSYGAFAAVDVGVVDAGGPQRFGVAAVVELIDGAAAWARVFGVAVPAYAAAVHGSCLMTAQPATAVCAQNIKPLSESRNL